MILTSISNSNPFPLLCDLYIDAANPLANANNIPANNSYVDTVTDLGIYRALNIFSQPDPSFSALYLTNNVNGQNIFDPGAAGGLAYMTCPWSNPGNNYAGSMTITVSWMSSLILPGVQQRMFGRQGANGFSIGQDGDAGVWENIGTTTVTFPGLFAANIWNIASFRLNADNSVDCIKNGTLLGSQAAAPVLAAVSDLVLFALDSSFNLSWSAGSLMLLGWSWRALTNAQINLLHGYAMGRAGI